MLSSVSSFTEPEGSWPCSQQPATGPCPELDQTMRLPPFLLLGRSTLVVFFLSTSTSSWWHSEVLCIIPALVSRVSSCINMKLTWQVKMIRLLSADIRSMAECKYSKNAWEKRWSNRAIIYIFITTGLPVLFADLLTDRFSGKVRVPKECLKFFIHVTLPAAVWSWGRFSL
jgi:hypothetical protein